MNEFAVAARKEPIWTAAEPERCSATLRVKPLSNENGSTPLSSPAQFSFVAEPETVFESAVTPFTCTVSPTRPTRSPERPSTSTPVYVTPPCVICASFTSVTEPETPTEPSLTS